MSETQYRVVSEPTYCNGSPMPHSGPKVGDVVSLSRPTPDRHGDVLTATVDGKAHQWWIAFSCLEEIRPFKVGDRVRVAHPADSKVCGPVIYTREVVATVSGAWREDGDLEVVPVEDSDDDNGYSQTVSPEYLTLVSEDEPKAEEPEAPAKVSREALDFALALAKVSGAVLDTDALLDSARKIQDALA